MHSSNRGRTTAFAAFALVALLGVDTLGVSNAALCGDYGQDVCDTQTVDTGDCAWNATAIPPQCEPKNNGLPPNTVAVTAVEGVDGADGAANPVPELETGFPAQPTNSTFCSEPADPGLCRAAFPAWFYNEATQACEEFLFGGCVANSNAFETKEACDSASGQFCATGSVTGSTFIAPTDETFCQQPSETGMGRASISAFYYDADAKMCKPFIYGGTGGNENRFETLESCQKAALEFECNACTGVGFLLALLLSVVFVVVV